MSTRQKVDEAKSSQAESRTQNRVLECLTRFSEQGRVQGFHVRYNISFPFCDLVHCGIVGPARESWQDRRRQIRRCCHHRLWQLELHGRRQG